MKNLTHYIAAIGVSMPALLGSIAVFAAEPEKTTAPAAPSSYDNIADALLNGKPLIDLRYRLEEVQQDKLPNHALANTVRARLGYETGVYEGFSFLGEIEHTEVLGDETFNDSINNKKGYPTISDPENTDINRLYVKWQDAQDFAITAGRQYLAFDNERFIGRANWRQSDNTFDAVELHYTGLADTALDYAHSWGVNRVYGTDSPVGRFSGDVDILHANHVFSQELNVSAYAYLLDLDGFAKPLSTQTYGARATGVIPIEDKWSGTYAVEAASQSDYGSNPNHYTEPYYVVEPGIAYGKEFSVKFGDEVLSGNGKSAVQTPLASNHPFNGLADKFSTATPANGLEDRYIKLGYAPSGSEWLENTKFTAEIHDFGANKGNAHYGNEWDVGVEKIIFPKTTVGVAYASYDADTFSTDTQKFWFYTQYIF